MADRTKRDVCEVVGDRHYYTVEGHDGAVPGAVTYTLALPLPGGKQLVVQGGDALFRQIRLWAGQQGEVGACRRPCCQQAPPLPGFERLVAA